MFFIPADNELDEAMSIGLSHKEMGYLSVNLKLLLILYCL